SAGLNGMPHGRGQWMERTSGVVRALEMARESRVSNSRHVARPYASPVLSATARRRRSPFYPLATTRIQAESDAAKEKPPAKGRGFPFLAEAGCLWEEVALHAQHAAPHAFVGRRVQTGRPVAAAAEVERDLRRIHVLANLRPHHFDADVEVLH